MSSDTPNIVNHFGWLATATIGFAVLAGAILVWYLIQRPKLGPGVRMVLLFGFGIMPVASAFTANIAGYEQTKRRGFCGSCHVMTPYTNDSENPNSKSLAASHARNPFFGGENCYVCHENYGMFGTVVTKLAGMRHVWLYYTEWRNYSIKETLEKIEIVEPFPNGNCMQCHSTDAADWSQVGEHVAALKEIRSGQVSCASEGCHGPAHPFSKLAKKRAAEAAAAANKRPAEKAGGE